MINRGKKILDATRIETDSPIEMVKGHERDGDRHPVPDQGVIGWIQGIIA